MEGPTGVYYPRIPGKLLGLIGAVTGIAFTFKRLTLAVALRSARVVSRVVVRCSCERSPGIYM